MALFRKKADYEAERKRKEAEAAEAAKPVEQVIPAPVNTVEEKKEGLMTNTSTNPAVQEALAAAVSGMKVRLAKKELYFFLDELTKKAKAEAKATAEAETQAAEQRKLTKIAAKAEADRLAKEKADKKAARKAEIEAEAAAAAERKQKRAEKRAEEERLAAEKKAAKEAKKATLAAK